MSSPLLVASTDTDRQVVVMTVEGSFTDREQTEVLRDALPALPIGYGLLVDLSGATAFAPATIDGLRDLARDAKDSGQTLIVVCSDLERRAELVLADLDSLAPVVEDIEQAIPLVHRAA